MEGGYSTLISKLEKSIGIEVYATSSLGVGGIIKQYVEDFVVEEVLVDGSMAAAEFSQIAVKQNVLGSSGIQKQYLLCVMVKRNWDTLLAIKAVAQQLGINVNRIQIAGIKDARAVTAQHITVEGVTVDDVSKVNIKDIKIKPVGYFRTKISPYFLQGNNFHVSVGGVNYSRSIIEKRITKTIDELKKVSGIPNFFGHQRFGTIRPITHLVGKALIKGNFKKAIMLFLAKPSVFEHVDSKEARQELRATQDFQKALKNFPKQLRYERLMLKRLTENPKDYLGAFKVLPQKLQRLFVQAYQAYLFNKFLSRRIKESLLLNKAEVGDYVVNVERSGLPMLWMHKMVTEQNRSEINKGISVGKMRLALPLIGYKQLISHGFQGEIERQILEEEGIACGNFKVYNMPEMSSRGELRTAIAPLNNFNLIEISADSANLQKHQIKVGFNLHRGSYATVFLRELMKPRNPLKAGF